DGERARQDARAGVRQTEQLQHALDGPILPEPSVEGDEDAVEAAAAKALPRCPVHLDRLGEMAVLAERPDDLGPRAQRYLPLSGAAAAENSDLHPHRPTRSTSVSNATPKRSDTLVWTRRISRSTSEAVAPPSLTMKLACCSEMRAAPSRAPFMPEASTSRPAESPGGFLKTLPQFLVLIGWVRLRSAVKLAIWSRAAPPSPPRSRITASVTTAPARSPSRRAE